ncbi:uncharacterized protein LOC135217367 [Macrobrachium nipponense]|uniref:uncharacterized protein LOC135217367 n=1 Tax=Macrobrachium nipponense TaxID=159736 RepID=UPI0030C7BBD6
MKLLALLSRWVPGFSKGEEGEDYIYPPKLRKHIFKPVSDIPYSGPNSITSVTATLQVHPEEELEESSPTGEVFKDLEVDIDTERTLLNPEGPGTQMSISHGKNIVEESESPMQLSETDQDPAPKRDIRIHLNPMEITANSEGFCNSPRTSAPWGTDSCSSAVDIQSGFASSPKRDTQFVVLDHFRKEIMNDIKDAFAAERQQIMDILNDTPKCKHPASCNRMGENETKAAQTRGKSANPTGTNKIASPSYESYDQNLAETLKSYSDVDNPWRDASMCIFSQDGKYLINERKTMIEVVHVEFRDRAAFPNTEWRLIPPVPDVEKPQKETVLLAGNLALRAVDETLHQVNGTGIYSAIMNKTQVAHLVPPAFCPFTFKVINHVKTHFQNYVVTREREPLAELKPFASIIPVSGNSTEEWATLQLPFDREKLPLDIASQQFGTPMRRISEGTSASEFRARTHLLSVLTTSSLLEVATERLPEESRMIFAVVAKSLMRTLWEALYEFLDWRLKARMEVLENSNKSLPNVTALLQSNPFCRDLFEESIVIQIKEQAHQQNCTVYALLGKDFRKRKTRNYPLTNQKKGRFDKKSYRPPFTSNSSPHTLVGSQKGQHPQKGQKPFHKVQKPAYRGKGKATPGMSIKGKGRGRGGSQKGFVGRGSTSEVSNGMKVFSLGTQHYSQHTGVAGSEAKKQVAKPPPTLT